MAEEKKDAAKAPAKKPAAEKAPAKKAAAKAPAKAAAEKAPAAAKAPAKKAAGKAPAKAVAEKAPAAAKATVSKATAAKAPAAEKTTAAKAPVADKAPASKAKATEVEPKVATLKMHHLRPAPGSHQTKIRVGRGEGGRKGKTAGRGTKGTGARYQVPLAFEGGQTPLHMRIPKLRGFRSPFKVRYQVVNLDQLEALFPKGGKITKADLIAKGAVRNNLPVKVLGDGEIAVKVTLVDADAVSRSAKTKIEAAGGTVNEG
jgi:large subunit ribosomal protein L15